MFRLALRRQGCPRSVARGKLQMFGVLGFGLKPSRDVSGETSLGQRLFKYGFQLRLKRKSVDFARLLFGDSGQSLALHKPALNGKQRRQFGMPHLQVAKFALDSEQSPKKIFEIRRELNNQL